MSLKKLRRLLNFSISVHLLFLLFANLYPEQVETLALVCGPARPVHQIMLGSDVTSGIFLALKALYLKSPSTIDALWRSSSSNPLAALFMKHSGFNPKLIPHQFVETYIKRLTMLPQALFFKLFEEMMAHDCLEIAGNIHSPCLVVSGLKDKVIFPEVQVDFWKALPNASRYVMFEGSHVPHADSPEHFNERLDYFLKHRQ